MPTENPKISLYVPQAIYDRFKQFQEEQELSMSQAGIVILAEYFGLKQTIERTTEGSTIGGVTYDWVKSLEKQVKKLEGRVDQLETTGKLPLSNNENIAISTETEPQETVETVENKDNSLKKDVIGEEALLISKSSAGTKNQEKNQVVHPKDIQKQLRELSIVTNSPRNSGHSAAEEIKVQGNNEEIWTPASLAKRLQVNPSMISRKKFKDGFTEWTRERDPENVGWITLESGQCKPERSLSSEQVVTPSIKPDTQQEVASITDTPIKKSVDLEQSLSHIDADEIKSSQLNLLSEPLSKINPVTGALLAKRLGVHKDTCPHNKKKLSSEEFYEWSKQKDFDGIGWIPNPDGAGYILGEELSGELLNKLQKWIEKNS
jgi:hypothetical protein